MQNLDITTLNGYLNIEIIIDGGVGIYYSTDAPHGTLMLNKEQLLKLAGWIITYLEQTK